jgi:hypothetical protein
MPMRNARASCANIEKLGDLKPSSRAPSDGEDALERWRRLAPEPEKPKPERQLDTAPVDVNAAIAAAIGAERERLRLLLIEPVGEIRSEADAVMAELKTVAASRESRLAALTAQLHGLRVENANARADIAELRAALASGGDRGTALLDQPSQIIN